MLRKTRIVFICALFFFCGGALRTEDFSLDGDLLPSEISDTVLHEESPKKPFFLYATPAGKICRLMVTSASWASGLVGAWADSRVSKKYIKKFIHSYHIDPSEAELPLESYTTLNDFFTRKLKEGARAIDQRAQAFASPCDSHVLVIEHLDESVQFPIKGALFNYRQVLKNPKIDKLFKEGTGFVFRLEPGDYHRFHAPYQGIPLPWKRIKGHYDSVQPVVYARGIQPLEHNERHVFMFNTPSFPCALVPVGALFVGRIKETYTAGEMVDKGAELGYFAFGGSTLVLFVPAGKLRVREDLVRNSKFGKETPVKMGALVAEVL